MSHPGQPADWQAYGQKSLPADLSPHRPTQINQKQLSQLTQIISPILTVLHPCHTTQSILHAKLNCPSPVFHLKRNSSKNQNSHVIVNFLSAVNDSSRVNGKSYQRCLVKLTCNTYKNSLNTRQKKLIIHCLEGYLLSTTQSPRYDAFITNSIL